MWGELFSFILIAAVASLVEVIDDKEMLENALKQGLEEYLRTGEKSEELEKAVEAVQLPLYFRQNDGVKGFASDAACIACRAGVSVLLFARQNGASKSTLKNLIEKLCVWLRIESELICEGAVTANIDVILYIVDKRPKLKSKAVCSLLLQDLDCDDNEKRTWRVSLPPWGSEPPRLRPQDHKASRLKPLKILQLTDIHYDASYANGSNAKCDEPICCRAGSLPSSRGNTAGPWGDYRNCDTPWRTIENALNHIVEQHKDIDYVYFTGDIINHIVWDTSIEKNTEDIIKVLNLLEKVFGSTPVYPILGNHEPHPVNQFSPDNVSDLRVSNSWVYRLAVSEWARWLPLVSTNSTIQRGGFYTLLLRPGLRLVALNSNVCYIFNWWLWYEEADPFGQLKWLVDVLWKAEKEKERVHILSHIPSGDVHCAKNWGRQYFRIVNRFAHIITGQFNGHTHYDETVVYFNASNPSQAINVAFNGGSLSTYSDLNPNYKVYAVDPESTEILDFESWIFNITDANLKVNGTPDWYRLYSFKDTYSVENLMPHEVLAVVNRLAQNTTLATNYFRYKYRDADSIVPNGCNKDCQLKNFCYMVTTQLDDNLQCEIITNVYYESRRKVIIKT